jgi:hypothetical protein
VTDEARPRTHAALTDHQHEGNARRAVLEVVDASVGQRDRWVLVHTLQRRLGLEPMWLRAALAQAQAKGWVELDAKRVRLLDAGRDLIGGHQRHRRFSTPIPERAKHHRRVLRRRRRSLDMPTKSHW